MDEHAYGFTTENSHYGACRNPHDPPASPAARRRQRRGGSRRPVPLTLGSDTNGSIRVPASLCGVFGLKPTFGRLPRTGSFPFVGSLDHLGPFAADATSRPRSTTRCKAPTRETGPAPSIRPNPRWRRWPRTAPCAWPCWAAISPTGPARRRASRATGRARSMPPISSNWPARSSARRRVRDHRRRRRRAASAPPGDALRLLRAVFARPPVAGSRCPPPGAAGQRVRHRVYRDALALFARYDVLIAPATPVPATPIGAQDLMLAGRACRPAPAWAC